MCITYIVAWLSRIGRYPFLLCHHTSHLPSASSNFQPPFLPPSSTNTADLVQAISCQLSVPRGSTNGSTFIPGKIHLTPRLPPHRLSCTGDGGVVTGNNHAEPIIDLRSMLTRQKLIVPLNLFPNPSISHLGNLGYRECRVFTFLHALGKLNIRRVSGWTTHS